MKLLAALSILLFVNTTLLAWQEPAAEDPTQQDLPPITFLDVEAAAKKIAGNEDDEFFLRLHPREAAAMTATPRGDKSKEESQSAARSVFQNAVLEFEEDEKAALSHTVEQLVAKFGNEYPMLVRRPWNFVKSKRDLCGGFSFTRGDCIVLSQPTLANIVRVTTKSPDDAKPAEGLLLHEQMHVLERRSPELFVSLFQDVFRFRPAKVTVHPWIDERQVTNPDAVSDDWILEVPRENGTLEKVWIGTILRDEKNLHQMGRDFSTIVVGVHKTETGDYEMEVDQQQQPVMRPIGDLTEFTARLPIRGGYDHPNEVAAYLFTVITHGFDGIELNDESTKVLDDATAWFRKHLKSEEPQVELPPGSDTAPKEICDEE